MSGHFAALVDPDNELTLQDVAFGPAASRFEPLPRNVAMGYRPDALWLKITVKREGGRWPEDPYLHFHPIYLDRVDIHVPRVAAPASAADFLLHQRGDHFPAAQPGRFQLSYAVPLHLPDADAVDIYVMIQTDSALVLRGWIASPTGMQDIILTRVVSALLPVALSLGATILSFTYWFHYRRRHFMVFGLHLLANCYYILANSGVFKLGSLTGNGVLNDMVMSSSVLLVILSSCIFIREYLETRRHFPRVHRGLEILIGLQALALLTPFLGLYRPVAAPALLSSMLVQCFFVYGCLHLRARYHRPGSLAAALAAIVQCVTAAILVFWIVGGADFNGFYEYTYWIGAVPFTLLMSLSLILQARWLEQRRRESVTIRMARRAEGQAKALVAVRTRELQTAKEVAENALAAERESQSEQLRFIDVVRHQYKTPLAVIRNSVTALRHTMQADDWAGRERVGRIQTAVRDLVQILDVSLQRDRMEGSTVTARLQEVFIAHTLHMILDRIRHLHPERDIILKRTDVDATLTGWLDPDMLAVALSNLIENAVKFSDAARAITISCACHDGRLDIDIRDQGIGIPEDEKDDVIKRYFRATNAGPIPGTGLGLHIVDAIARAHGGLFQIDNHPEGGVLAHLSLSVRPGSYRNGSMR
ncbi:ATP-binding protein [Niveispirillum fermenti]|uniref:sensor histidine kinase n=1 Tax=Niveispirillum fermenti TaxID=1233113 RepID=UPI003A889773